MKLDVNVLRYLSKDDFRVLTAVEMGMRNHEIVPSELVDRIASLKHGGTYKVMKNLLKYKLLHHDSSKYDGFRLTYLGYDFLAIKTLVNRGVFVAVGRQIGVGKESDIFEVAKEDGTVLAMKLHRLGRISFRSVKSKRDYLRHRSSYNWLYLSRLAAVKEFAFMKALEEHGFPVPNAVDCNRHCVIMSLVQGYPLVQVKELQNPDVVFETILGLVVRLAEHGLIHCDFNEFNIMIDNDEKVTMIDFRKWFLYHIVMHRCKKCYMRLYNQILISFGYFDRDVECIFKFFRKRFNLSFHESVDDENDVEVENDESARPCFSSIAKGAGSLDKDLAASGFTRKDQEDIEKFIEGGLEGDADSGDEEAESSKLDEMDNNVVEHLQLLDEETLNGDENAECQRNHEARQNKVSENDSDSDNEEANEENGIARNDSSETRDDDNGEDREENDETELNKRLNKQRRRAIASASGGRKARASRNTYKDKGRKSSNNSKLQKQIGIW